jgi:gliding motility-associated-like protein
MSDTCLLGNFTAPTVNVTSCSGSSNAINSLSWNFGDPTSGANNTSSANTIAHTFSGPGVYTVTLILNYACGSDTIQQNITIASCGFFTTSVPTNILCNGACTGTATATPASGTSPYTYSWNTTPIQNTQVATNLCAGTYTVTVTDATNATATSVVTVTQLPAMTITTTTTASTCQNNNGSATVATVNGGTATYTYLWTPGGGTGITENNLAPGTYTVTITDANGCTKTATATVLQTSGTLVTTVATTGSSCISNTGSATASTNGGNPAYTYVWSPGGGAGVTINNLAPGTYTVSVTDASGCTTTASATVIAIGAPTATVSPDITIGIGASTVLVAGGGGTYTWIPTTGLSCTTCANPTATPSETTTYCVEVLDAGGCKDTACVTVRVEIPCPNKEILDVPNAFSPNRDGLNDDFCLLGWDACLVEFKVFIFDRWGETVFKSTDPNFCWDGKYNNQSMDSQVFVYYIKATYMNTNEAVIRKGNISLLR